MATHVTIELPERASYGELMKAYLTLMRAFGLELASVCNKTITPNMGNWWFSALMEQRIDEKKIRGHQQDLHDPIIVLNEVGREYSSPIHVALPPSEESRTGAKKIVAKRNELLHFSSEPSIDDIGEVARLVQLFARHYHLATDGAVVPLLARLQRIKRGQYVPKVVAQTVPAPAESAETAPPPPPPVEPPEQEVAVTEAPRPRIGGVWHSEIPTAEFKATRTGDLVSVTTGESIRDRILGDPDTRLRSWLAPKPKGNLWIADDGAIGGFVAAVPRLLGYLGEDPPGEVARGFLYSRYFEVSGRTAVDLSRGSAHELADNTTVTEGEMLRLTTYGDLIRIDDDGVTRVAQINPADWA